MLAGVRTKRVYKDVHVGQNHSPCIRSSRSLELFKSTPGNVPPEAVEMGNCTRDRRVGLGSVSTAFNPSSNSDVRVRPCSAALFFARRSKSPESLTVVLICQSILL